MVDDRVLLRLGHSPDPDDAFMWWPLMQLDGRPPAIDTGRFRFESVMQDIQTLNERSLIGDLEITAISMHQYAHVCDRYAMTSCGASMGERYGPKIVAKAGHELAWLRDPSVKIAIPGRQTTAFLALSLLLEETSLNVDPMPFEQIIDAVQDGRCDAGLIIHEGQLTYEAAGLVELADLGKWWSEQRGLPLPLGANVIRRDLDVMHGSGTCREITSLLVRSIEYALSHWEQGVDFAEPYAHDTSREQIEQFIRMYVNDYTLDAGDIGERAIRALLNAGRDAGLSPDPGSIELIRPLDD
jgi:1,4-dihydroxy-6-naphthoate synthase